MSDSEYWKNQAEGNERARRVWMKRHDDVRDALFELLSASPGGDELRLLCVGTNGPAMSDPKDANGRAMHARCDRLTRARLVAAKILERK